MKKLMLAAVFAAAGLTAAADKLFLKDGRTYEGKIVEEGDAGVKIKTSKATLTFPKDQIDKIERGTSMMETLEGKLEELSPEAPETYVATAEWCVKEKVGDEPTVERLANIAMALDPSFCGRGNTVLGDFAAARGDRVQAAEFYFRAFLADWKNPVAKRKLQEYKDALEERNARQMDKLRDALTLAIDNKLAEAIPALSAARGAPFANLISTYMPSYRSVDALIEDIKARVPCKTCNNKGTIKCFQCDGTGSLKCTACGGKGYKEIRLGGTGEVRKEICPVCNKSGKVRCPRCKEIKGATKCSTCKGIIPAKPTVTWDRNGLVNFRGAIEQRMSGVLPIEEQVGPKLPRLGSQNYDASFVDDGRVVYSKGRWLTQSEKK
ncbi:MAG: hypothetical protein HYY18_16875 [Planctomycetes bacterium]|nr:hypothetical protein [Planctomycetota bacterium]